MNNNQATEQPPRLTSFCYSELKRYSNCPKEFWLRFNRVGETTVTVETPESIIGEVVHRVISGQDHPRRVKKLLEKFQQAGTLVADNLVEMERECHKRIKAVKELKNSDASPKTKTEKKFYYKDNFDNPRTSESVTCTLVTKLDREGEFQDGDEIILEIVEVKTGKQRSRHMDQLFFGAIPYALQKLRERYCRKVKLVLHYATKSDDGKEIITATKTQFASQYSLERFLETRIRPTILEINERMETGDFPANVIPGLCRACPFAAQCEEYQASLNASA